MTSLALAPNQDRSLHRDKIPDHENFSFHWRMNDTEYSGRIVNYHSFGAAILVPADWPVEIGAVVTKCEIRYNQQPIGSYPAAELVHAKKVGQQQQWGFHFASPPSTQPTLQNTPQQRANQRLAIPDSATMQCPHPTKFEELLHFSLVDISRQGTLASTSLRNRNLLRKTTLNDLTIHLPLAGSFKLEGTIRSVRRSEGKLLVGIEFDMVTREFEQGLVKFLLAFGHLQNDQLLHHIKGWGIRPKAVRRHVTYAYADTVESFRKVLTLRHQAYRRAEKVNDEVMPQDMTDVFDLTSQIIIARLGEQIVGSVRVTTCTKPSDRFELEESIRLPPETPRYQCVEMSRLCVSDEFKGSDLILGLIEKAAEIALKLQAHWVITSCTEDLWHRYKKMGFQKPGLSFHLRTLGNVKHHYIVLDLGKLKLEKRYNLLHWLFIYRRPVEHLQRFQIVPKKVSPFKQILLKILTGLLGRKLEP